MHIMEGFLPWQWCIVWWLVALPFIVMGILELRKLMQKDREYLPLLGVCGAFIFILSALKLPQSRGAVRTRPVRGFRSCASASISRP